MYTFTALSGKWIAPDDVFIYSIRVYLTPGPLSPSSSTVLSTFSWKLQPDFTEDCSSNTVSTTVNYNGVRGELSTTTPTLAVYGYEVNVPSVTVGISSSAVTGTRNSWLYIDGDVSGVSATDKTTGTTLPAAGNGKWIALGLLTVNSPVEYALKYTLNGMAATGSVRVYLVSDFEGGGWTPDLTSPAVTDDAARLGQNILITTAASANSVLQGSITVPSDAIGYGVPYNVDVSIDSRSGEADVINPVVTLDVPSGQTAVTGSWQYQYPAGGDWTNIPSGAIEISDGRATVRTSGFASGDFVLYGNKTAGRTDAERTLNLRLVFSPECATDLNGFNYRLSVSGTNLLGSAAAGMSGFLAGRISTNVSSDYYFEIRSFDFRSGKSAFGGQATRDVLEIEINKYSGTGAIAPGDYLEVSLPLRLDLSGTVTVTTNVSELTGSLHDTPVSSAGIVNTVSSNTRTLRIPLPVDKLNGTTDNALGMPFTCNIPLVYREDTGDTYLRANPVQGARANVYTKKSFSSDCPDALPFSISNMADEHGVVLLTMESSNPYTFNMACVNEPFSIEVTSAGFTGNWYSDATMQTPVGTNGGRKYGTTPTAEGVTTVYVDAEINNDDLNSYTIQMDIKTPPATLYWTGTDDSDWKNPDNWGVASGGGANTNDYLPAPCTNVELPSGASAYPVLQDSVAANVVTFKPGAELAGQNLLVYDSARVELALQSNRWYMLSSPLQDLYTGDFYRTDPNPYADGYLIEPMLFNIENPETGIKTSEYKWTGSFNNADHRFEAGQGFALWVDKIGSAFTDHSEVTFSFPKADSYYCYYSPESHAPTITTGILERGASHRLFSDRLVSGNLPLAATLSTAAGGQDHPVLVGNPFMAHLDFNEFYQANSSMIYNQYKLASGVNTDEDGKVNDVDSYEWDGSEGSYTTNGSTGVLNDGLIAPMQSFFVIPRVDDPQLFATAGMTTTSLLPDNAFRAAGNRRPANLLEIFALREGQQKKVLLFYRDGASPEYRPEEDSRKLFPAADTVPVSVYMRSPDGYALDINYTGNPDEPVAVGIRTARPGAITLRFEGMESFDANLRLRLHDTRAGRVVDLSQQAEYTFVKEAGDSLYLENRFYLSFSDRTAFDAPGYTERPGISVTRNRREIRILSGDGAPLGRIRLFDLQGRTLLDTRSQDSSYAFPVRQAGVYIVRVENPRGDETKKVGIK